MLYDGAVRFLRQAEVVLAEGVILQAQERMNRAEAIIDELLAVLDTSVGEVAQNLQGIYVFCKRFLMEARIERDPSKLVRVRELLSPLRDAWAEIAARP